MFRVDICNVYDSFQGSDYYSKAAEMLPSHREITETANSRNHAGSAQPAKGTTTKQGNKWLNRVISSRKSVFTEHSWAFVRAFKETSTLALYRFRFLYNTACILFVAPMYGQHLPSSQWDPGSGG